MRRFRSKIFARRPMNLENLGWGLKTLPHSDPGAWNSLFFSPLSPVSGEFPFSLGNLLDSELVPTAATREILIVFLPVLLPAGGRKVQWVFLPGPEKVKLWAGCQVSPTLWLNKIEPFFFNRCEFPRGNGLSRDRLVYVLGPSLEDVRAIWEKRAGWKEPMKSQGRASEPAQAKIGTRRLEEQHAKGKAVETADSPVRHTVRLTTADREVTIPLFLFQFPGVNSECRKFRRWINQV